jgi:hypothetical protein
MSVTLNSDIKHVTYFFYFFIFIVAPCILKIHLLSHTKNALIISFII